MIFGGIELGGTKIVCGIGDENANVLERVSIPTTTPQETLEKCLEFFKNKGISSLGIGSFGPVDLNENSKTYGHITTTPKKGWEFVDVISAFKPLNVPIGFDTDVDAACIGEVIHGAGKGLKNVIYGTIGTGIGFGVYLEGKLIHGLMHPEAGHILITKSKNDRFEGNCPYHSNCLEGLASGPAIEKRWGKRAEYLGDKKEVWELEANYLSQAMVDCVTCYSPQRIILGGGVMHNEELIKMVRVETLKLLNGYIHKEEILEHIDEYIVLPKLGDNAGLVGCIELGRMKLHG